MDRTVLHIPNNFSSLIELHAVGPRIPPSYLMMRRVRIRCHLLMTRTHLGLGWTLGWEFSTFAGAFSGVRGISPSKIELLLKKRWTCSPKLVCPNVKTVSQASSSPQLCADTHSQLLSFMGFGEQSKYVTNILRHIELKSIAAVCHHCLPCQWRRMNEKKPKTTKYHASCQTKTYCSTK